MRKLLRFVGRVLGVLALLVLLSPWLLYELGLSRFEAMPSKPAQLATVEQQAWAWERARGVGMPKIERMNPYGLVWDFFSRTEPRSPPAELLVYWVASDYNLQQPRRSMGWWHLSNAALCIWLTRHWTTEELTSAAYAIAIKWPPPRKPRSISPES